MKARDGGRIRLTPRSAEILASAIDALVIALGLIAMRLLLHRVSVAGVDGWPGVATTSWGLVGIVMAGVLLVAPTSADASTPWGCGAGRPSSSGPVRTLPRPHARC